MIKPLAYLKEWEVDGEKRCRVDLHSDCEPWLRAYGPRITSLYARSDALEPGVVQNKFDLAFDILRQMQAEDMDTMQSVHFGYVLRVERRPGPADLVGALQDVVHTDPGPVRAGHAVRATDLYSQCTGEPHDCPYIYCHSQLKCARLPAVKAGDPNPRDPSNHRFRLCPKGHAPYADTFDECPSCKIVRRRDAAKSGCGKENG